MCGLSGAPCRPAFVSPCPVTTCTPCSDRAAVTGSLCWPCNAFPRRLRPSGGHPSRNPPYGLPRASQPPDRPAGLLPHTPQRPRGRVRLSPSLRRYLGSAFGREPSKSASALASPFRLGRHPLTRRKEPRHLERLKATPSGRFAALTRSDRRGDWLTMTKPRYRHCRPF